jgi:hypothetical protein
VPGKISLIIDLPRRLSAHAGEPFCLAPAPKRFSLALVRKRWQYEPRAKQRPLAAGVAATNERKRQCAASS